MSGCKTQECARRDDSCTYTVTPTKSGAIVFETASVNTQINLYVFSRVAMAFGKAFNKWGIIPDSNTGTGVGSSDMGNGRRRTHTHTCMSHARARAHTY